MLAHGGDGLHGQTEDLVPLAEGGGLLRVSVNVAEVIRVRVSVSVQLLHGASQQTQRQDAHLGQRHEHVAVLALDELVAHRDLVQTAAANI